MAKVKKPAKHLHDQEVKSYTAVSIAADAIIDKPYGLLKITSSSGGLVSLPDGHYNGQKLLISSDNSHNTNILGVSGSIRGCSRITVASGQAWLGRWYHDGTNGFWYGLSCTTNGS